MGSTQSTALSAHCPRCVGMQGGMMRVRTVERELVGLRAFFYVATGFWSACPTCHHPLPTAVSLILTKVAEGKGALPWHNILASPA